MNKLCDNWLEIFVNLLFLNQKLLDHQKELINDFVANTIDRAGHDSSLSEDDVAYVFENELEKLNTRLDAFAEKVEDNSQPFSIKGMIQLIYKNTLFSSLIGEVSIIIVRNKKTYFAASNDISNRGSIDTFSDFIEGEIQPDDRLVVIGTNYQNLLDEQDMKELDEIWSFDAKDVIDFFEKLFTTKIDPTELGIILVQNYKEKNITKIAKKKNKENRKPIIDQKTILKHKYNITIWILWSFIIFLAINVISTLTGSGSNQPTFILEDGTEVTITLDKIKKDINDFVQISIDDPIKAEKYQEVVEQLAILESENRRPEEVKKWKQFIQEKYYEWFNVVLIDNIEQNSSYFENIYPLGAEHKSTLGELKTILYNQSLYLAGTKWVVMQGISADIIGNLISYNDESITMKGCSFDLSQQGLYCFDDSSNVYRVTQWWVQPLQTDDSFFPSPIHELGTFTSSNLYILHDNQSFEEESKKIISRYSNKIGSYTDFWSSVRYINRNLHTGTGQAQNFSSMSIDGTFLVWEGKEKKLYQLWREPDSVSELSSREVPLLWWDNIENWLGENVKVIQLTDSPYVFLFDKDKMSITVYRSNPKKTSSGKQHSYNLLYVFRMQFDKTKDSIIDITIPTTTPNFMYILTEKWVYETNIETFIKQFEEE